MRPRDTLVVVWDGAKSNATYGCYLNVEYYPTRPAPTVPKRVDTYKQAVRRVKPREFQAWPAKPVRRPKGPTNAQKQVTFQNGLTLIIAQLKVQPLTIAELIVATGKKYWNVRHCLTLIGHLGILRSKQVGATGGRPTQAFWIDKAEGQ